MNDDDTSFSLLSSIESNKVDTQPTFLPKVNTHGTNRNNVKRRDRPKASSLYHSRKVSDLTSSFRLPPWMNDRYLHPYQGSSKKRKRVASNAGQETKVQGPRESVLAREDAPLLPMDTVMLQSHPVPPIPEVDCSVVLDAQSNNSNQIPIQDEHIDQESIDVGKSGQESIHVGHSNQIPSESKSMSNNMVPTGELRTMPSPDGNHEHAVGDDVELKKKDQAESINKQEIISEDKDSELESVTDLLKAERKLKEKLTRGYGLKGIHSLKRDTCQIQTKDLLGEALQVATDIQNLMLRKNWPVVRDAFRFYGGIMSPKSLRMVLLREVGLPTAQAARIENVARTELMEDGDMFVLYEDFKARYKRATVRNRRMSSGSQADGDGTGIIDKETESDKSSEDDMQAPQSKLVNEAIKAVNSKTNKPGKSSSVAAVVKRRQLARLREKLAGRAHTRGEIHREDAARMLNSMGSSLFFLNVLDQRCAKGMKKVRVETSLRKENSRFSIATNPSRIERITQNKFSLGTTNEETVRTNDNGAVHGGVETIHEAPNTILETQHSIRLATSCNVSDETLARSVGFEEASLLRNIAEVRNLAAHIIQACVRIWLAQLRVLNIKASKQRLVTQQRFCRLAFRCWYQDTLNRLAFYQRTRRVLYCWSRYSKALVRQKFVFRTCYWPFHVWRRHWSEMAVARSKSIVLLRVWRTTIMLRCFKGIKSNWMAMNHCFEVAEQHHAMKQFEKLKLAFVTWQQEIRFKTFMKSKWMASGGNTMIYLSASLQKYRALRSWWYYTLVRKRARFIARESFMLLTVEEATLGPVQDQLMEYDYQCTLGTSRSAMTDIPPSGTHTLNGFPSPVDAMFHLRGLRNTGGINVKSIDFDSVCSSLQTSYVDKVQLIRRQLYFQFQTLMPRIFNRWVDFVELSRRTRFGHQAFARKRRHLLFRHFRKNWLMSKVVGRGFNQSKDGKHSTIPRTKSVPMIVYQPQRRKQVVRRPTMLANVKQSVSTSRRMSARSLSSGFHSSRSFSQRLSRYMNLANSLANLEGDIEKSQYQVFLQRKVSLSQRDFEMAMFEYNTFRNRKRQTDTTDSAALEKEKRAEEKRKRKEAAEKARQEAWNHDMEMAEKMTKEAHNASIMLQQQRVKERKNQRKHVKQVKNGIQEQINTELQVSLILKTREMDISNLKAYAKEHGQRLHYMRAQMMHDVLCKVIEEIEDVNMARLKLACFNRIRLSVMESKAMKEVNKGKLKHWLHICANFRKLNRSVGNYRKLRMKMSTFSRWLKFVDTRYRYQTPGYSDHVSRRVSLLVKFDLYIIELEIKQELKNLNDQEQQQQQDVKRKHVHRHRHHRHHRHHHHHHNRRSHRKHNSGDVTTEKSEAKQNEQVVSERKKKTKHHHHRRHHHHHKKDHKKDHKNHEEAPNVEQPKQVEQRWQNKQAIPGDIRPFYYRWVEYTESRAIRKQVVQLFAKRRELRIKHKVLWSLHQTLRPEHTYATRTSFDDQPPFGVLRATFDLDLLHTHFLVPERRLMTSFLRRTQAFTCRKLKQRARSIMTLKKLQLQQREVVEQRLELETRLLVSAFHDRGSFHFKDNFIPSFEPDPDNAGAIVSSAKQTQHGARRGSSPHVIGVNHTSDKSKSKACYSDGEDGYSSGSSGSGRLRTSGTVFNDKDDALLPNAHTEIKELIVHICDGFVHSLRAQYRNMRTGVDHAKPAALGGARGARHVYALDCTEGEKLVGVEILFRRFIYRVRFHTSFGRTSPWYGDFRAQGERFLLGRRESSLELGKETTSIPDIVTGQRTKVVVNKFVTEYIVGFHGKLVMSNIQQLGIYQRQVIEKGVFVGCWKNKVLTINQEDEVQMETNESRQFAYVLRMRAADIRKALERSQELGKRMYRIRNPELSAISNLTVIQGVSNWLFNTLSVGLLGTPNSSDMCGEELVENGHKLIEQGRHDVEQGREFLHGIPGYSPTGAHEISLTLYGKNKYTRLMSAIHEAEEYVRQGETMVEEGQELVERGMRIRPQIPDRVDVRAYFEHLVKLAQMKDTIGKVTSDCDEGDKGPL